MMKGDKQQLNVKAKTAVVEELNKRGIYKNPFEIKNRKDIILEAENKILTIKVNSKQGKVWPNCKGIPDQDSVLILVDFEGKDFSEYPDFYILNVDDWIEFAKEENQRIQSTRPYKKIYIDEKNVSVFEDEITKGGKVYRGNTVKPNQILKHKEKWHKIKEILDPPLPSLSIKDMDILTTEIDGVLESLLSPDKLKAYEKWKREYKNRVFDAVRPQRTRNLPPQNTQPPGFEANLVSYLFEALKGKDPHCEWNYKSHVKDSKQAADLVFIQPVSSQLYEVWVEVGMFVGDVNQKYRKDFGKLTRVIDKCPLCIGVLVHLESMPRGTVFRLFKSLREENCSNYSIDVRKIGDESTIHIVRLIIKNK